MTDQGTDTGDFDSFVAARTPELHRTGYLLMADQEAAEQLVAAALHRIRRQADDLGRAGAQTRLTMARLAAPLDAPTSTAAGLPGLSPRQRAVLLLRVVDGLDSRATAKELRLPKAAAIAAERAAATNLGLSVGDPQLRSQLDDFAERASWPDPTVTLDEAARKRPQAARPRWTYAAALVVIVASIASVTIAQVAHNRWLRTPAGLNSSHGTHFPEYVRGYKLVEVRDLRPRQPATVRLPKDEAYVVGCPGDSDGEAFGMPVTIDGATDNSYTQPCMPQRETNPDFFYLSNTTDLPTQVEVTWPSDGPWPLAVYRKVPWDQYPVATKDFDTSRQLGFDDAQVANENGPVSPLRTGPKLTLSSGSRANGSFTATLRLPAPVAGTQPSVTWTLRATTTGRYRVSLAGRPLSSCFSPTGDSWCEVFDRVIPPIGGNSTAPTDQDLVSTSARTAEVRVDVEHAVGPWKLEMRYDRYKVDKDGNPVAPK
ncbi:hypothetical protein [Flexivirga meconopsidis]|uniref:hypothetical protein n=1 Tax=Flexivirga meconopsidis TaxID=2977121 RepID=UPI00223FB332|nr:hypothetical protein [Flexivirga meconopsidis]